MGEKMSEIDDQSGARANEILNAILRSPKVKDMSPDMAEALSGMIRELGAAQEDEIRRMKAEYDAKLDRVLRAMDNMAKGENYRHDPLAGSWEEDTADGDMRGPGPHHRNHSSVRPGKPVYRLDIWRLTI